MAALVSFGDRKYHNGGNIHRDRSISSLSPSLLSPSLPPPLHVPALPSVTSGACVVPPPPWLVLVLPPLLLGGNTLQLLPWRLPSGEGEARSLGAALCCSAGRARLLFKQHQVSWGSALSEGKELGASQLLGSLRGVTSPVSAGPGVNPGAL